MEKAEAHLPMILLSAVSHIKSLLCSAELLSEAGGGVTFVNTHYNHVHMAKLRAVITARFSNLTFESIDDGLTDDGHRTILKTDIFLALETVIKPLFRELFLSYKNGIRSPPVTCVIRDSVMSFPIDMANEFAIPSMCYCAFFPSHLWGIYSVLNLLDQGQEPFVGDETSVTIAGMPEQEGIIRRQDTPIIYVDKKEQSRNFKIFMDGTLAIKRSSAVIPNTFDGLQDTVISQISSLVTRAHVIGPIHLHQNSILHDFSGSYSSYGGRWMDNKACIEWLNPQPMKSVVYVSLAKISRSQCLEFWHGLVNSGQPFLWVIRPDLIIDDQEEENGKESEAKEEKVERVLIVDWAPQEGVLTHPGVGVFLTHSGWNSVLESIVAGVPMICWPRLPDQYPVARWVNDVWKVGYEVETPDKVIVEKLVRSLMTEKNDDIRRSMDKISNIARESVVKGESSRENLKFLVEDLQAMKPKN